MMATVNQTQRLTFPVQDIGKTQYQVSSTQFYSTVFTLLEFNMRQTELENPTFLLLHPRGGVLYQTLSPSINCGTDFKFINLMISGTLGGRSGGSGLYTFILIKRPDSQ